MTDDESPPTAGNLTAWAKLPGFGKRTLVMGIVNVTPDSFSGDGVIASQGDYVESAVALARQFIADGADIIDVGAESTRPGADPVQETNERARLIPAIRALAIAIDRPISIDTRHAATAAAALDAGAAIINDVSGLTHDPEMVPLAAARKAPVVIMHNDSRGSVQKTALGSRFVDVDYADVATEVATALRALADRARDGDVAPEQICIDPGIGFGKTREQNLDLLNRMGELKALGYPILLGSSRKSFIGYTLDLPAEERVEGTAATVAIGIDRGADIVRVHDVKPIARVARMTDAIVRRPAR